LSTDAVNASKILDATIGIADLGDNSVGSAEVAPDSLGASDLGSDAVGSSEVVDHGLDAADIGDVVLVNRVIAVDAINGNACNSYPVAVAGGGDLSDAFVLVTPDAPTANGQVSYSAEASDTVDQLVLKACNASAGAVDDTNTTFQFLVIR
jgi:hypothetical protein